MKKKTKRKQIKGEKITVREKSKTDSTIKEKQAKGNHVKYHHELICIATSLMVLKIFILQRKQKKVIQTEREVFFLHKVVV